jgi:beta-1,4-mannosyltransferase
MLADTQELELNYADQERPAGKRRKKKDHTRTWHRLFVTVTLAMTLAGLYWIQSLLWPTSPMPHGILAELWSWTGVLWAAAFLPAAFEITGLYLWKPPPPENLTPVDALVALRIVSRGLNKEALAGTITECRRQMELLPLFGYIIEAVIDTDTTGDGLPEEDYDLQYLRVPKDYTTDNDTRAKARALNYALWESGLPEDGYIMHLDEESRLTRSSIVGMAEFIREEQKTKDYRIGQGTITYHRKWSEHPFFTLADCIRTGSDLGRLYLAMILGVPVFGLHGSFILLRNDLEQRLGLDIGPVGSLTEDAWWGTMMAADGVRCRWVHGYIAEQCTERTKDFLKQRRRWFNGLARTAFKCPTPFRWRASLLINMLIWASAPFAMMYTIAHLFDGGHVSPVIRVLANFTLAVYITATMVGLKVNMKDHGIRKLHHKVGLALMWILCLVGFSLLESTAVAYAIIRPAKTFDVVKK